MKVNHWSKILAGVVSIAALSVAATLGAQNVKQQVSGILDTMPIDSTKQTQQAVRQIMELGRPGMLEVCVRVKPPEQTGDAAARYAVQAMTTYAGGPKPANDTAKYVDALATAIDNASSKPVKQFFIEQMRMVGGTEAVKALRAYLDDSDLCDPAARALVTIDTDKAARALADALGSGPDACLVNIVKALGQLRHAPAADRISEYTDADDSDLRRVALWALASIGPRPDAGFSTREVLLRSARNATGLEKTRYASFCLLYARRLAAASYPERAARICGTLMGDAEVGGNVRCAALQNLARLSGENALANIIDAADIKVETLNRAIGQFARRLRTVEALKTVGAFLEVPAVSSAAASAATDIACPRTDDGEGLTDPGVAPVLRRAGQAASDEDVRTQLEEQLNSVVETMREKAENLEEKDFTALFNGRNLTGWAGDVMGYRVEDGRLICPAEGGGNLLTEQTYSDFALRFQFKLTPGANNGLAIRAPRRGNAAFQGMELQILDNTAEKYQDLHDYQYHGSVYGVVPAEPGHLKPTGQWNTQEVVAIGPRIVVRLNGETIVDANIDEAATPEPVDGRSHPGLRRSGGHIGFMGHGSRVEFRNIRICDLSGSGREGDTPDKTLNQPPEGFTALFNGKNLEGWRGALHHGNPYATRNMSPEAREKAQQEANGRMREHWKVKDGVLVFDGRGRSVWTDKNYEDFILKVDWQIEKDGDSGIYLRGLPQVQIWDPSAHPEGSGGLYNNKKNASKPLQMADNPPGEWNTFRIKMTGRRVTVHLNGVLVVDDVPLENYWKRGEPIPEEGPIMLQSHGTVLRFRNIFIKELSD